MTIKTKQVIFFDSINSTKYNLNLVSIDGEVYVHWSEIFRLFACGLKANLFKDILLNIRKEQNDFITTFEWNESNHMLFEVIELNFNIDLDKLDETKELIMIKYKELYVCVDAIFGTEKANQIKNLLRNNRISKKADRDRILENTNIKDYVTNDKKSESLKSSLAENDRAIVDMLTKLKLKEEYINSKMSRVQDQAIIKSLYNESKEIAEEIEFYKNKLS